MSQGHCLKDRPMQKTAHWRKGEWATMCRGLPSSLERVSFLLVDVLPSFPSIQQNAQGNQLMKRKCWLWLLTLEHPACDWLAPLLWAAGTAIARHDWGCQTEQNCSCNGLETNKRQIERNCRSTGVSRAQPQWPKALLWALTVKVIPLSDLHSEN